LLQNDATVTPCIVVVNAINQLDCGLNSVLLRFRCSFTPFVFCSTAQVIVACYLDTFVNVVADFGVRLIGIRFLYVFASET